MQDIMQDKYILGQSIDKTISAVGEEIRLDLQLEPNTHPITSGKIQGLVTDSNGDPIESALIKIMSSDYAPLMHQLTDTNGMYSFVNIPPNQTYNIFAVASGMKTNQGNQFTVSEYQDIIINFTLMEDIAMTLGVIAGDLVDQSNNNPVGGAVVSLFEILADNTESLEAVTYTNEYGQYTFREVSQGNYIVKINALGYNNTSATTSITQPGQLVPMEVHITQNLNTSRGTVSGIITNNNNQPINRADVILYKVNQDNSLTPISFTKTNQSGIYLFANVEPGTYKVKSNETEIVNIDIPGDVTYAPNFSQFQLFYTENYIINEYKASQGTLGDGASVVPSTGFVGGLDQGFVTVAITVPSSGAYYLAVEYLALDHQILSVSINGGTPLNAMCFKTVTINPQDARIRYIQVFLNAGNNAVKFYNKFTISAPNINTIKVSILPYASSFQPSQGILQNGATAQNNFIYGIGGAQNGGVSFKINVPVDGNYVLGISYLNADGVNKNMKITVDNGFYLNEAFKPTPTDNINDAVEAAISIGMLTAGEHTVEYYNDTGTECPIPGPTQARIVVPIETTLAKNGTLENGASILSSGYVSQIGGSNHGAVTISVDVSEAGQYALGVQYVNKSGIIGDIKISINGGIGEKYIFPQTASNLVEDAEIYYININLIQGNNTIKFYNDESVTTQSPVINEIFVQKILIDKVYSITDTNITLLNGAQIQNGLITNIGYGLGEILLTYSSMPFYGPYFLKMNYVTTASDRQCNIDVNNVSTGTTYTFEPTTSSSVADAKVKKIPVTFGIGTNTIRVYTAN